MKSNNFFKPVSQRSKIRKGITKGFNCTKCGLYQHVHSPRMEAFGNFRKGILNIGEGPGEAEDLKGKQWQGKVGKTLQRTYSSLGIDLFEDCLNINTINCRPTDDKGNNRAPTDDEIACCRKRVLEVIEQYKPKVIILLGGSAIKSIIGYRWKKDLGGISKWRGWTIPDKDFDAWVCPTFHPSYIDRQGGDEVVELIWKQDLEQAISMTGRALLQYEVDRNCIEVIDDKKKLEWVFESLALGKSDLTCLDYETTGLKPHAKGHRIVCAAIATSPNHAYAFMMPTRKHELVKFGRYLASLETGKIAANIKFEENWSKHRLGYGIKPWIWDTMQAAHILDNRPGITSVKFQACIRLGVYDYNSLISPYLEGKDKRNSNSLNRIFEFIDKYGEEELLIYCGLDALYEYKIAHQQMYELGITFKFPKISWLKPFKNKP